jgi:sigma-B regulation protein RsbU (phosphoserine phosphatase)
LAWLLALNGDLLGKWYALDAPCLVGRASLNHVVLDDPRISRQHAKIAQEEDGFVVYDLGSANGTFVDDEQVKRQRLGHGATLRFGPYSFSFKETRDRARTVPAAGPFGGNLEVRTLSGLAPPVEILDSLAVAPENEEATSLVVLEEAYRKLSVVHGFMRALAAISDTAAIVETILAHLIPTFAAREVTVYLFDDGAHTPQGLRAAAGRAHDGEPVPPRPLPPAVFEEVVRRGRAVLTATPARPGEERRPVMHAPLVEGPRVLGVIAVGDTLREERFHQRDLDLLAGLAAVAALSLHGARHRAAELRRQRLEQDLKLAREIQESFLPRALPATPRVDLAAEYRPVYSIGGDVYDALWLDERRLGLFIGDVAGKGIAAALQMARVTSDLRVAVRAEPTPSRVLARVNAALLDREQPEGFVTGVFLSLEVETGKVVLASAGHCPPVVRRASGRLERIDGAAAALGFFRDTTYVETELVLAPGDALVLYTDGVVEARDRRGVAYGEERLAEAITAARPGARALADDLLAHLGGHAGSAAPADDLTLMVVSFR